MTSPWRKILEVNELPTFGEIEAEERERSRQEKILQTFEKPQQAQVEITEDENERAIYSTDSDAEIARMLQSEFNNEYNLMLTKTEQKLNGDCKVHVSYDNFRVDASEPEEKPAIVEGKYIDRFVPLELQYAKLRRRGFMRAGPGSEIMTKHDLSMSSSINAARVLEFPPGIKTGDTASFDTRMDNKVFNSLRAHSFAHCAREKDKLFLGRQRTK